MTDTFTPAARAVFEKKALAHVATLMPDGSPNVTPVWVMLDGNDIIINTHLGRSKARNLATDARVALSLTDPDDAYVHIAVMGTVTEFTTDGADAVIDQLSKKYLDVDAYPWRSETQIRVTVRIRPDRISMQPQTLGERNDSDS
jgi:pyridoxine/pyridoxamine 5'-phosphate oxidase